MISSRLTPRMTPRRASSTPRDHGGGGGGGEGGGGGGDGGAPAPAGDAGASGATPRRARSSTPRVILSARARSTPRPSTLSPAPRVVAAGSPRLTPRIQACGNDWVRV